MMTAMLTAGCFDVTIPAEDPAPDFDGDGPPRGVEPGSGPDDPVLSSPDASTRVLQTLDSRSGGDDGPATVIPDDCDSHCDCPPDYDCINARCALGAEPIQCCGHDLCPTGAACWHVDGTPGTCGQR